jgi:hypothetical protein
MAAPRLFLATPCHGGQVTIEYLNAVYRLQAACEARGIGCRVELLEDDRIIARARARLAARFLADPDASHLLFVDADIAFAPEAVFRLLAADRPLVAGVCPAKRRDWPKIRAMALAGAADLETAAAVYVVRFLPNADKSVQVEDGFARVAYAGAGVMLIARAALEQVAAAHPDLTAALAEGPTPMVFEPMIEPETGQHLSEDYAFCRRFRDLGGEVWADVESAYAHVGHAVYRGALIQALNPPRLEPR